MTDFEQVLMQSQQRIENNIQECLAKLASQGERIAASEAHISEMKESMETTEKWNMIKFAGSVLVSVASAVGIKHMKI
jgi:hypothetical protein